MCLWLMSLTAQDCSIIMVCMKIVQSSGPPCHLPAGLFRIFSLPVHHNTRHNLDSTTFSTTLYTEHLFQNLYSRQAALTNRSCTSKSRVAETRATPLPQFTGSTDPNFWQSSDCRKIGSLEPKVSHGNGRAKNKPEAVSLLLRSWCFSTSEGKKNHFFQKLVQPLRSCVFDFSELWFLPVRTCVLPLSPPSLLSSALELLSCPYFRELFFERNM